MKTQNKTKWHKREPKRKKTPTLLSLQIALYNAFPTQTHKAALAGLRANLAEACYRASLPKSRIRL